MGQWEQYVSGKADILLDQLRNIEKNIDKIIRGISVTSETSSKYWNQVQRDLRGQYEQARKIVSAWLDETIPIVYRNRLREEFSYIKNLKINPGAEINVTDFISGNQARQRIRSLIDEAGASYFTGITSGNKTLIRLSRLTQQLLIEEKAINKSIAEGFLEKGTLKGSKKKLQRTMMKRALDGETITVIDKNGNPINYHIDTYAELVAHTKLMEAATQATVDAVVALGGDLVEVSVHNTDCEVCAPYEGKIYSLTGNDPDFPDVEELPPFHPRCKHTIDAVFRTGLEADGTLDKYIEFSNDETDVHPTRTSFVPVSKRELI